MKTVLIVDDASFMRKMIRDILEKNHYVVVGEARNGIEAISEYKKMKPHIIIMDITMPDMNGVEALKQIKAIDKDVRVVMCSAMGQQEMVVDAIRAGAKDFIVKPFQAERLIDSLNHVD